ncbi:hypothetical protein P8452_42694 [Trifolium repens]|nr:hypothetical protein P8452_42694 [Trifolium repens]
MLNFRGTNNGIRTWRRRVSLIKLSSSSCSVYHRSIKTKFENAIQIYRAGCENKISKSKKDKIKWHKIKCPCQRNGIDCGYFIMRFMKEVIMEYPNTIPDNYFDRHIHHTYSKEKLDEIILSPSFSNEVGASHQVAGRRRK